MSQKLVNETIKSVNTARDSIGKDKVDSLTGIVSCPTNCAIAASLGTRARVGLELTRVRSRRVADKFATAWGTSYERRPSKEKGLKDFPYVVVNPRHHDKFMTAFDNMRLLDLPTTTVDGTVMRGHGNYRIARDIITVRSDIKRVSTVEMSVNDAIQLVNTL